MIRQRAAEEPLWTFPQPILENFRAFIVYATLHKLDAFNMRERQALNRVEIAKSR